MTAFRVARPARFRPVLFVVIGLVILVLGWVGLEVYNAYTARPGPVRDWGSTFREHTVHYGLSDSDEWQLFSESLLGHERAMDELQDADSPFSVSSSPAIGHLYIDASLIEPGQEELENYYSKMAEFGYSQAEAAAIREESVGHYVQWLRDFRESEAWDRVLELRSVQSATPQIQTIEDAWDEMFRLSGLCRDLRSTLCAQMVLAKREQDWDHFSNSYEASMASGWILGSQPLLLGRISGFVVQRVANNEVANAADQGQLPDAVLARVRGVRARWKLPSRHHTIEGARLMTLECVDKVYDQRERRLLGGRHAPLYVQPGSFVRAAPAHWLENMKAGWYPRRDRMVAYVNGLYEEIEEFHNQPLREQLLQTQRGSLIARLKEAEEDMVLNGIKTVGSPRTYVLELLNDLGLDVSLALAEFRNSQGRLPGSLEELVPDFLDVVPPDPLSPDGEPLRYTLDTVRVGLYRVPVEYLLYSVGLDGVDDNATPAPRAMSDSLRPSGSGTDYILNDPDWR